MKVIFLDVDGVLNNPDTKARYQKSIYGIDPALVMYLNQIIRETQAKVVLSSTWRLHMTIEQFTAYINECGFVGEIIGKTPRLHTVRGEEIKRFMDDWTGEQIERYIIIDDSTDMLAQQWDNFVNTSYLHGLTPKDVEKAISILNGAANQAA